MRTSVNQKAHTRREVLEIVDALSFHIQFLLQMNQGTQIVKALGFPGSSTNEIALKRWIRINHIHYYGLKRPEMAQEMAKDIHHKCFEYFQRNHSNKIQ